jgi:O-antigen polysaccharide polymerase Wzy
MNAAATSEKSPFLRMPESWRLFIVVFLLAYEWVFPTIAALNDPDANALFLPRVAMQLVYVLLLCLPLIFYRREYGFLHPLILPTLFTTAKEISKFPAALASPIKLPLVNFDVPSASSALSIHHLTNSELAWTRLEYGAVQVLALVCYYAGYFVFTHARGDWIRFHRPRNPQNLGLICFAATMFCVVVGAVFVELFGGGLSSYVVAIRGGRHEALAGTGQFLQIASFAVLPALVWFAYRKRMGRNLWWILAIVLGSLTTIITTGSRSSLILPLLALLLLWWQKAGRVLIVPTIALVLVGTLVIGAFGSIREDHGSSTINTSVLDPTSAGQNFATAQAEFEKRNSLETDFAAFAGVGHNELLWGRSYIGAATFFIPRALWPEKPFGGGAYNQAVNFAGRSVSEYKSGKNHGIPMGPVTEAYWNFSLPGVIVLFFLLGMFFRELSAIVWRNADEPAALVAAVWIALNFVGTSVSFISTIRDMIMLGILFYALGIVRSDSLTHRSRPRRGPAVRPVLARRSG